MAENLEPIRIVHFNWTKGDPQSGQIAVEARAVFNRPWGTIGVRRVVDVKLFDEGEDIAESLWAFLLEYGAKRDVDERLEPSKIGGG